MSQKITKYRIFLASPNDLLDERAALDEVVQELNLTFGSRNNLILEIVKWETHSAPGISQISTQEIINNDTRQDYDLFLGILWKKFGTPTTNAESGTEEEFNLAYKRFCENPTSLQVLFYFKNSAPKSLSEINPNDLIKINSFREKLGALNTFYWEFNTVNEFQGYLRLHIPMRIETLISFNTANSIENILSPILEKETGSEELGLLDFQEIRDDSIADSGEALSRMTEAMTWIGEKVNEKTAELNKLNSRKQQLGHKEIKDFCLRLSTIMNDFANRIDPDIPIFINGFEKAINAMTNIIDLRQKGFVIDKEEEIVVLNGLKKNIETSKSGIIEFLNSVTAMPRMSKELNKARRNVEDKLSILISKLEFSDSITYELKQKLLS